MLFTVIKKQIKFLDSRIKEIGLENLTHTTGYLKQNRVGVVLQRGRIENHKPAHLEIT